MEARRVAAAWTLTKKRNTTANGWVPGGFERLGFSNHKDEELKCSGNYERCFKGPVGNILAGFMISILVTAQHIAHEYFIKSTYLLHNKSNLVFLAFREALVLKLNTVKAFAAILNLYSLRNKRLSGLSM